MLIDEWWWRSMFWNLKCMWSLHLNGACWCFTKELYASNPALSKVIQAQSHDLLVKSLEKDFREMHGWHVEMKIHEHACSATSNWYNNCIHIFSWDHHFWQVRHTAQTSNAPRWSPLHHGVHRFKPGDSCRRSHGQSAKGRTSGAQICSSSSYCGTASFEPLDQGMSRCGMLGRDVETFSGCASCGMCSIIWFGIYVNVHVIDLVRLHVRMVAYRKT